MTSIALPVDGVVLDHASVLPAWLDYNGHMNVAWFMQAFELGIDSYKTVVGLDPHYIARSRRSTVALESHITYQREALLGDALRIETRILDCDGKRVHVYQELCRGAELLASQETLAISFDIAARRSCPFEPALAENYRRMVALQAGLPRPVWVGRAVGLGNRRG